MEAPVKFEFTTAARAPTEAPRARGTVLIDETGAMWTPDGLGGHTKGSGSTSTLHVKSTQPIVATATPKRVHLESANTIRLQAPQTGSINFKFTDASGALSVSASSAVQVVGTNAVDLAVPAGLPFLEYQRNDATDVVFSLGLAT